MRTAILRASGVVLLIVLHALRTPLGAEEPPPPRKIVKAYNACLKDAIPIRDDADPEALSSRIEKLVRLARILLNRSITDPEVLQNLNFVDSYEALASLREGAQAKLPPIVESWQQNLIQLDIKAQRINNFKARPSARWVLRKAESIPETPSARMREGYIERSSDTVYIAPDGTECKERRRDCQKLHYVLVRCLLPGIHDLEMARERLHRFPPELANPRMGGYWEVPLSEENLLIRRNYEIRPLPGYEGTMETYYRLGSRKEDRLVIVEENTRVGRFILRSDNAAVFIKSPPHGVTFALIMTGKYVMEQVFMVLVGDKLVEEPTRTMAILRQYILNPQRGFEAAVHAGRRDYKIHQAPEPP